MATRSKRSVKTPTKPGKSAEAPVAPKTGAKAAKSSAKTGKPRSRARAGGSALVIVESPTKAKTIGKYLGAGYDVKATVGHVRDLPEREREIRAFTPQEYWSIEALLASNGQTFEAALAKIGGHKPQLHSAEEAQAVVDAVRKLPFVVTKVEKRHRRKNPAAPFTTSTIQQEAAKKLGFSSRRTMRAAQDLYEGMDVGEDGPVGLITYMRTDSVRVSDAAIASVRDFISKNYAKPYLPDSPNGYSSRKNARVQDAHEAIRPTDVRLRPEQVQKY